MNLKDEHTSRLWTFIMKGEIMLRGYDLLYTRVNNGSASEVEKAIYKMMRTRERKIAISEEETAFDKDIKLICDELTRIIEGEEDEPL